MLLRSLIVIAASFTFFSVHSEEIREVNIRTVPNLYLNIEYGAVYSNTGSLPAKLELVCGEDGKPSHSCGQLDVRLSMQAYGVDFFLLDYTRKNPLTIKLHVNPQEASLGDILGSYMGGRAGGGLVWGARGMLLVNTSSGVFATTGQGLYPGKDDTNSGFNLGLDLSVPNLQVTYEGNIDLTKPLASLVI